MNKIVKGQLLNGVIMEKTEYILKNITNKIIFI